MKTERVDVGGCSLWVCASGEGEPVLLASGGPGCCDYLGPVARLLDDAYRVIRFEQRGCGRSDPSDRYVLEDFVADVEAVRAHFGLETWTVGGHSWGANLALAYALAHSERCTGLVYLAGNGVQNDRYWSETYHRARDERGEVEPEFAYPHNLQVNEEMTRSWRAFCRRPDLWRRISASTVPALLVQGDRDIRPNWPAEQLAAALPSAEIHILEGAGHVLWHTHAAELQQLVRAFLAARARRPGKNALPLRGAGAVP